MTTESDDDDPSGRTAVGTTTLPDSGAVQPALPKRLDRRRPRQEISRQQFDALLDWFNADRSHAAEQYEGTRAKVIWFLEFYGCPSVASADLADAALSIAAKRLASGKTIRSRGFFLGTARKLLAEYRRRVTGRRVSLEGGSSLQVVGTPADMLNRAEEERLLVDALRALDPADRELLVQYAKARSTRQGRAELARRRGKSTGALYTQVHRLRLKLRELLRSKPSKPRS